MPNDLSAQEARRVFRSDRDIVTEVHDYMFKKYLIKLPRNLGPYKEALGEVWPELKDNADAFEHLAVGIFMETAEICGFKVKLKNLRG